MTCNHQFLFVHTLQLYKPLLHDSKKEAKVNEETNRSWHTDILRIESKDLTLAKSLDSLRVLAIRLLAIVDAYGCSELVKRLGDA